MKWYIKVIKKYADFSGRARRMEYWMFALFNILFMVAAVFLDNFIGTTFDRSEGFGFIFLAYLLFSILPSLAVAVRRFHDQGKSGGWFFIRFVPFIGSIWYLILMVTGGDVGSNQYGQDPKNESDDFYTGENILDSEF